VSPSAGPDDFVPGNLLEDALVRARAGQLSSADFLRVLLMSTIAVPSAVPTDAAGRGLQPVVYDRAGVPMVATFSALARAAVLGSRAPYCLTINGRAFLAGLPREYGMVLNPGLPVGMDIPPAGIQELLQDLP
jgi:hypothetical protein